MTSQGPYLSCSILLTSESLYSFTDMLHKSNPVASPARKPLRVNEPRHFQHVARLTIAYEPESDLGHHQVRETFAELILGSVRKPGHLTVELTDMRWFGMAGVQVDMEAKHARGLVHTCEESCQASQDLYD